MIVNPNEEVINGARLHQMVQPKESWIGKLANSGCEHLETYVRYFNTQFICGSRYDAPGNFHLALSLYRAKAPAVPHESWLRRLHDLWLGSVLQLVLSGTYVWYDLPRL